jgi:hypothetical protein
VPEGFYQHGVSWDGCSTRRKGDARAWAKVTQVIIRREAPFPYNSWTVI